MADDLPTPLDLSIVIEAVKQRVVMVEVGKHYTCTAYHGPDTDPMHMLISNTQHCALCLDQWPCQQTVDYAAWSHLSMLRKAQLERWMTNNGMSSNAKRLVLDG